MASRFEWYTVNDDANGGGIDGANWEAQTFTIGTVGDDLTFNLSSVDVKVFDAADSTIGAKIYNVLPDGSPDITAGTLSEGTLATDFVGAKWYNVSMTTTTLKAGQQYALVLDQIDSGYTWREDASSPSYAGGSNWTTGDTGVSWAEDTAVDKMFQINGGDYTGTLCTLADAINKAGANAAPGAINESLVSDFVKQAEGKISAMSRHDWVDAYSTLSDDVKFILNETASEIAAIKMITYDMSGYTDRVEAETMINVYREDIALNLSLLKDKQVKTFIVKDT